MTGQPAIPDMPRPAVLDHPERACHGLDDTHFLPEDRERPTSYLPRIRSTAALHCARCPILDPCRAWGHASGQWGLWGGVLHLLNPSSAQHIDLIPDTARSTA